jgi:hypothetical protein
VQSSGAIACWGDNTDGQSTPPADIFKSVSAGGFHTCGVRTDGTVACWGNNTQGQIVPPADSSESDDAGTGSDDTSDNTSSTDDAGVGPEEADGGLRADPGSP